MKERKFLKTLKHDREVSSVTFNSLGTILASTDARSIKLWDVKSGQEIRTIHTDEINGDATIAFSPDGEMIARGGDPNIQLWDIKTGEVLNRL